MNLSFSAESQIFLSVRFSFSTESSRLQPEREQEEHGEGAADVETAG